MALAVAKLVVGQQPLLPGHPGHWQPPLLPGHESCRSGHWQPLLPGHWQPLLALPPETAVAVPKLAHKELDVVVVQAARLMPPETAQTP